MTLQDFAYLGNDITRSGYGSDLQSTVKDMDGNTVAILKAEAFGAVYLDFAPVLRTMLSNGQSSIASAAQKTRRDLALTVKANIDNTDYIFVRAVSRIPGSLPQYTAFKFLTKMPRLLLYTGYPLTVSYIVRHTQETLTTVDYNGANIETNQGNAELASILKYHATVRVLETSLPGTLSLQDNAELKDSIYVHRPAVPAHPFYIRWVNDIGGWDYFMFACQYKVSKSLTENKSYEPFASGWNAAALYGMRKTYSKRAKSTIEVSSGIIDRQTLESLQEAVFSPLIQWYEESRGRWIDIQIEKAEPNIMADQPTGELIMTFELPTPQLNK